MLPATVVGVSMFHGLADAAIVRELSGVPMTGIVLSNTNAGGTAVTDRTSSNQYEAMGQMVEDSALDGDEVDIKTLYLKVAQGSQMPVTGTHEIDIWIGEWNTSTDSPGTQLVRETFDVVGVNFQDGLVYGFDFTTPFSLDQTKDYAFEVWWTSDDASHDIAWDRDTGQGAVDGGFISEKSPSLSLPFSANPANNTDLFFAFETIPEPSVPLMTVVGGLFMAMRRRRA